MGISLKGNSSKSGKCCRCEDPINVQKLNQWTHLRVQGEILQRGVPLSCTGCSHACSFLDSHTLLSVIDLRFIIIAVILFLCIPEIFFFSFAGFFFVEKKALRQKEYLEMNLVQS